MQDCTQPAFNHQASPSPSAEGNDNTRHARPVVARTAAMHALRDWVDDLRVECQAAFDNAAVGVLVVRNGIVERCNARFAAMHACDAQELAGKPAALFPYCAHGGDGKAVYTVETPASHRRDAAINWVRATAHLQSMPDGDAVTVWIVEDISDRKRAEQRANEVQEALAQAAARTRELESLNETLQQEVLARTEAEQRSWHAAHHDPLTGLANRMLLALHLDHALHLARRHHTRLALMYIDLDRFKSINDTLGHQVGDSFLRTVASRLQESVRTADLAARIGGDEFAVVLQDLQQGDDAVLVARKIMAALAEPMQIDGHMLRAMASIGICLFPDHGDDMTTLLRHADTAMYRAKTGGRNDVRMYAPEQD